MCNLGAGHDVSAGGDDRNGVFLNGRRLGVISQCDGHGDDLAEHAFGELFDGRRGVLPRHFHRYVVVLVKVDPGQVTTEQFCYF